MSDTSNTSKTTNTTTYYLSYLLRMWYVPANGAYEWRASLEEPLTQEMYRFEDLQSLLVFLLAQTGQSAQADAGNQPG